MSKRKEELRQEAIKMRENGYTLYEIKKYLDRNTSDEQTVKEIITIADEIRPTPIQKNKKIPVINLVLGVFLIISGLVFVVVLWGQGFIAKLPIFLIVVGIAALKYPNFNPFHHQEDYHLTRHKTRFRH